MKDGAVGLLDYGQAKQMSDQERRSIAATFLSVVGYEGRFLLPACLQCYVL